MLEVFHTGVTGDEWLTARFLANFCGSEAQPAVTTFGDLPIRASSQRIVNLPFGCSTSSQKF